MTDPLVQGLALDPLSSVVVVILLALAAGTITGFLIERDFDALSGERRHDA